MEPVSLDRRVMPGDDDRAVFFASAPAPLPLCPLGKPLRPPHDVILQRLIWHVILRCLDLSTDRYAGRMNGFGVARNERMPPVKVPSFGEETICAGRGQPDDPADIAWGEAHAIGDPLGPVAIILATTGVAIEKPAADIGKIGP